MAREELIEKLNKFLVKHQIFTEECHVVYLMVELRKLLDREREENFSNSDSLVRFHADWVLHTKKDHITQSMQEIMTKIDNGIDTYPKNGDIDFLSMPEFRKELVVLLKKYNLPSSFCKEDDQWLNFINILTQVLSDQPIINPTENIAEYRYIDIGAQGVMANINFRGVKTGGSIIIGFGL